MPAITKYILSIITAFLIAFGSFANSPFPNNSNARFIQNQGQWPAQVLFGVKLGYGMVFIEKHAITFKVYDALRAHQNYEYAHGEGEQPSEKIKAHAFKINFNNNAEPEAEGLYPFADYMNYFIGDDSSKWASKVAIFKEVYLRNYYEGIDLHFYESNGHLKYDIVVQPQSDPSQISFQLDGIESSINNGNLLLHSSIGDFIHEAPFSYQINENSKREIANKYFKNENNQYSFKIDNYNHNQKLIIDPVIVFASFTGSVADNRGFCATYDKSGHLYIAGIAYGSGYITTIGAYNIGYNGGIDDVVISKFSSDGSTFLYSTHLGGTGCEQPHSLVVDQQDQLSIFGTTGSTNFPTTPQAFDKSFNGGAYLNLNYYLEFPDGVDIFVTKFNSSGSALVGSTFIGGTYNDGLNDETFANGMSYNYGDWFRGEIINDNNGNAIVVTSTTSNNFPLAGAFQKKYAGGMHDGIVFKLNNNLSSLIFSSYLGGYDNDAAYSVQIDKNNDLYITGGTKSSNFPTTPGVLNASIKGGVDGFITHISASGNQIIASTFMGTSAFDQTYFIQLDNSNNVYVLGQTRGIYPITAGTYNNPNTKHFIHKLDNSLSTTIFSSTFGSNTTLMQMSPTAFLVSDCEDIYVSGWGGKTNIDVQTANYPNVGTLFGSMHGMPISADAFQSTTDGNDFYFAVFSKNMQSLKYGTFLGGSSVSEHVDGGTSRFDKKGNIYQAVCGGCYGSSDFPVTSGVWSPTNKSTNQAKCNEVGIKFSASKLSASIGGLADSVLCQNEKTHFINKSDGATSYLWQFGNGDASNETNPFYTYNKAGNYKITLIAMNPTGCPPADTTYINIKVVPPLTISASSDSVCPGKSAIITASGANQYQWSPASTLNKSTGAIVVATPTQNTTYIVNSDSHCADDTAAITIKIASTKHYISANDSVCQQSSYQVQAGPGSNFDWSPQNLFNNFQICNPTLKLNNSTTLKVSFYNDFGCLIQDSVYLKVLPVPNFTIAKDTLICFGESTPLDFKLTDNYDYLWTPSTYLNATNSKTPISSAEVATKYTAKISNECGNTNLYYKVNVSKVQKNIVPSSQICLGDTLQLWAKGGEKYIWSPASTLSDSLSANPFAFPSENTTYKVIIINNDNCSDSANTEIQIAKNQIKGLNSKYILEYGENAQITSTANNISWSPSTYLSCDDCSSPLVELPENDITYHYITYDDQGCSFHDSVKIFVIRKVYAPNAFTPNKDGLNEVFLFRSISVSDFELLIFNRWGELIFKSDDINKGWDGTYNGKEAEIDVYVWKVRYKRNHTSNWESEIGRVSLIR